MPGLEAGLLAVALAAERLEIGQIECLFRRIAHGLDMVHFEAISGAALDALEPIAPLGHQAQSGPTWIAVNVHPVANEFQPHE